MAHDSGSGTWWTVTSPGHPQRVQDPGSRSWLDSPGAERADELSGANGRAGSQQPRPSHLDQRRLDVVQAGEEPLGSGRHRCEICGQPEPDRYQPQLAAARRFREPALGGLDVGPGGAGGQSLR